MRRVPEPELMEGRQQAEAYAQVDFEAPHSRFIELLGQSHPELAAHGLAVDFGCGPGDITLRFAHAYPDWRAHGIDGSDVMLELARQIAIREGLQEQVAFVQSRLPRAEPPAQSYDLVLCNGTLHHFDDPTVLWTSAHQWGRPGAAVFVMDLLRPRDLVQARQFVEQYASNEPPIHQEDFFNSLLASYTVEEVRGQLHHTGLDQLRAEQVSDRHIMVSGHLPAI